MSVMTKNKKYICIEFDMDGTLIDSIPVVMESFQQSIYEIYGHRESNPEILKKSIGLPLDESFLSYPSQDQAILKDAYIKINDELQKNGVPLFVGIREMLIKLKEKNIRLAIVTSKRLEPTLRLLKVMELDGLFEVVVGKEMTLRHKPFGDPILKCNELLNIEDKKYVLYVGDSLHDLKCAKDAGVDVAAVEWTRMDKTELRMGKPEYWLTYPSDLLKLV